MDELAPPALRENAEAVIAQLQEALQTRESIGQAKGILMAVRGLDGDGAWSALSRASQDNNVKVVDLARALCDVVTGAEPRHAAADEVARTELLRTRARRTTPAVAVSRPVDDELAVRRGQHAEEQQRRTHLVDEATFDVQGGAVRAGSASPER